MADYTYRVKPTDAKLIGDYGEGGYTVKKTGSKKNENTRWVVTPKMRPPTEPSLGGAATDDPFGIKGVLASYNARQDLASQKHQSWAGDVRKWAEASQGTLYNAKEASNNAFVERMRGIGAPVVGANAPAVASSSGGAPVADSNAAVTNALNTNSVAQSKANTGLAALSGNQNNLNQLDYVSGQLKGLDYYASQIPSIYNESKTKYENSLTSAVLDLQAKKEIAQIGADASTYGAEQNLIASLAATQGRGSAALIQAISGNQIASAGNASRETIAAAGNASRERVNMNTVSAAWNRQTRTLTAAAAKAKTNGTQAALWKKTFESYMKGIPVKDPETGVDSYNQPGSVPAANQFLSSTKPGEAVAATVRWFQIATGRLGMSKKQAAQWIRPELGAQSDRIMAEAGRQLRWR